MLLGDFNPLTQRDKIVAVSSQVDLEIRCFLLKVIFEVPGNLKDNIFFFGSPATDCPRVLSAMSWIDDDNPFFILFLQADGFWLFFLMTFLMIFLMTLLMTFR